MTFLGAPRRAKRHEKCAMVRVIPILRANISKTCKIVRVRHLVREKTRTISSNNDPAAGPLTAIEHFGGAPGANP